MGNKRIFLLALLASALLSFHSFAEELQIQDWSPFSGISGISIEKGALMVNSASQMPLIESKDNLFINARTFNILEVDMASPVSYGTARLFFKRIGDKDYNMMNSFEIPLGLNNGNHTYVVNLRSNPNWFGVINQLVFQPDNNIGSIKIRKFGLKEGSLFLAISAGLEEFMRFERPLPRTINFIFGPQINGISVNVYIYYMIFFITLIGLFILLFKYHNVNIIIDRTCKIAVLASFLFWVFLDSRILIDQLRFAVMNYQIFGGNSFEEKQALSTFQYFRDFYYFLKICKSKLPERACYKLVTPEGYIYYRDKARYYLYPIWEQMEPDIDPDYLIVYDPQKQLKDKDIGHKGYKIFVRCGEEGYIMKRGGAI